VRGVAVPRGSAPGGGGGRPIVIYQPYGGYYPSYYGGYDPWYGWGGYWGWGVGLNWYYDPFWLGGFGYSGYGGYPGYGYGGYGYGGDAWSGGGMYYSGALKLKIKPRTAEVFVDGYYVGIVDDFDGLFQELRLSADPDGRATHRIEIRAPGAQPLTFEVRLQPGQTITYRGELLTASEPRR